MTKYARIENNIVAEVFEPWDPGHDDIAYYHNITETMWLPVPPGIEPGLGGPVSAEWTLLLAGYEPLRLAEIDSIHVRFGQLDQARARPLAAYALGRQTLEDMARLTEIENEAARLRARLAELKAEEIQL